MTQDEKMRNKKNISTQKELSNSNGKTGTSAYNKLPDPFFSLRIIFSRSRLQRMMSPSKLAVAR